MIKVAISGADSPEAGELVRILVNHPDVELKALIAPALEGKDITTAHHGLIGEPPMRFCSGLPEKSMCCLYAAPPFPSRISVGSVYRAANSR